MAVNEGGKMSTYKRIEAAKKVCDILTYLGNQKGPVPATDIAQAVGLTQGTAMCHLATMEDAGYVQIINDRYQVGQAVGLIWARVKSNLNAQRDKINKDLEALN